MGDAARLRFGGIACAALLQPRPRRVAADSCDTRGCAGHARARRDEAAADDGRRWFQLSAIDGGAPARAGTASDDRHIAWSRDSQPVYVQQGFQVPATVERVALATGARSIVRELQPEGVGAIAALYVTDWVDDGRWYAYHYTEPAFDAVCREWRDPVDSPGLNGGQAHEAEKPGGMGGNRSGSAKPRKRLRRRRRRRRPRSEPA